MNKLQKFVKNLFRIDIQTDDSSVAQAHLKEASLVDLLGKPLYSLDYQLYNNASPVYAPLARDIYPDKATTLRTETDFQKVRSLCRAQYESNGTAKGIIDTMVAFAVDKGFNIEAASDETKDILDAFVLENGIVEYYSETYMRLLRDGEAFVELMPNKNGTTRVRFIEPDFIRTPYGESTNGPWSFGILTPELGDKPEAYNVVWQDGKEEQIPAQYIKHIKMGSVRNVKRGIPALWACYDDLIEVQKLRYITAQGIKSRNAIAYFREYNQSLPTDIQTLQRAQVTDTLQREDRIVDVKRIEPGSAVDLNKNIQFKSFPPSNAAEESGKALSDHYKAIAACMSVPLWVVAGSSDEMSYASSLTTESPFVKKIGRDQQLILVFWESLFADVLEIELAKGALVDTTFGLSSPAVNVRNLAADNAYLKVLYDSGIISAQSWAAHMNFDYEKEQELRGSNGASLKQDSSGGAGLVEEDSVEQETQTP